MFQMLQPIIIVEVGSGIRGMGVEDFVNETMKGGGSLEQPEW